MDRYQFEDLISDYIEGKLPVAKRQEFEKYLESNPRAQSQVTELRQLISSMHSLPVKKTSADFTTRLMQRAAVARIENHTGVNQEKRWPLIGGFTPAYAGMLATLLVAVVVVSLQFLPEKQAPAQFQPVIAEEIATPQPEASSLNQEGDLAQIEAAEQDSAETAKELPDHDGLYQEHITLTGD